MFSIGSFTLTEEEVRKRKAYLEITPADERRLRDAHPHLQGQSKEIIDRFYDYLLSHDHTRRMLSAPGLVDRLKALQTKYFAELSAGRYDIGYFENRLRVGQAHDRVGLSPEWYLGAYDKYLHIAVEVLNRAFAGDFERFFQTMISLTKIIHLDMSLALDAYIFSAQERLETKNAALERSNEELQRLQAAKQQLTDMIVHDLQNPLAGIASFLQHLESKRTGLNEGEMEALEEALRRCDDLSDMIMNVLQVSRAEAGKLATYIENVDLALVARESVDAFRIVAERDGRSIEVEAPETLRVRTDQSLLRRVLQNLIRNAVRHTPGGTKVMIRVEAAPGGSARVSVIDDGPGIPPNLQPLIFERFGAPMLREAGLRVDSGLGLAFCKAAAAALGGRVEVYSDGRRGSSFTILLP